MAPFFDPLRCPICSSLLPARPLRCPTCGVELTGPTVIELVAALRRADVIADRMRAGLAAVPLPQPTAPQPTAPQPIATQPTATQSTAAQPQWSQPHWPQPTSAAGPVPVGQTPAPSWFAGTSVGVILLVLGALCVLAAGVVFIAVTWLVLPLAVRALVLVLVTASFGLLAQLALRRRLQATAEAMAVVAAGMFVLDVAAARRAGLPGLADLDAGLYEILAGLLLAAAAGAAAFAVRSRQQWLWGLDAAVAVGMVRAAMGALRVGSDPVGLWSVTVTVMASLLFLTWRRLRLPVAMWSAVVLGAMAWVIAVLVGSEHAADYAGPDIGRLARAWPALAVALVAGLWSIRLAHPEWRRVAACACLAPVLLVFEVVGWSHGWVGGTAVMLVGYVVAALGSGLVPRFWSTAVGGSAAVLGLSSLFGLLPTMAVLVSRVGPPEDLFRPDLVAGDLGPWLLPLTAVVVLGLLPQITIEGRRLSLDQHHTAAVFVATLGVLPVLYDAGFWVSFAVLVLVAAALLVAARLWGSDVILLLGLSVLGIMRLLADRNDLADPLAWTLIALAFLVWAVTESRPLVRTGFLTAAGLVALAAAVQWLSYTQAPLPYRGLVIVAVGSLGLLASQRLVGQAWRSQQGRGQLRMVGEGVSLTWAGVGLAMADSSPSHRAVELTVAGVAAGITAYLSPDRRRAGWASGVLLTAASWIRLADSDIQAVEWYTLPAAAALLIYGVRRLRRDFGESTGSRGSSLRYLGPGLTLALTPSLWVALDEPVSWRGLLVGLASVALVAWGVQARLAAPFALGVMSTGLLALRNIYPVAGYIPRWSLLFLVGGALLAMGMTWETRVNDVRTAGRYVRGLG